MDIVKSAKLLPSWKQPNSTANAEGLSNSIWYAKSLPEAALVGLVAGLAGTMVLNVGYEMEQRLIHRPDAAVPARTWQRLFGLGPKHGGNETASNRLFQWGVGAVAGAARGVMAQQGVRGPAVYLLHALSCAVLDRSLEGAAGSAPSPSSWPVEKQLLDVVHKGIFALVAGKLVDEFVDS